MQDSGDGSVAQKSSMDVERVEKTIPCCSKATATWLEGRCASSFISPLAETSAKEVRAKLFWFRGMHREKL